MTMPGDRRKDESRERGTVTAEFALGLPGIVATILLALGALVAGVTYVECHEAARVGAREAMLHGTPDPARSAAAQVAGPRATITVSSSGRWVSVEVEKPVLISGIGLSVSARMSAPLEGA